ncbi:MAG: GNAT family N-acetyltransferase [Gaiellaceae bacterium]
MRIETERLVLRLPQAGDVDELGAIYSEPETMRFIGGTVDPEDMPARIERMRSRWEERGFGSLVAGRREDGRIVGDFGVYAWETLTWDLTSDLSLPHEVELGWLLGERYRGLGDATEAALAVRESARSELAPPRLISLINVENEASAAVARRLGCDPTGRVETAKYGTSEIWVHP